MPLDLHPHVVRMAIGTVALSQPWNWDPSRLSFSKVHLPVALEYPALHGARQMMDIFAGMQHAFSRPVWGVRVRSGAMPAVPWVKSLRRTPEQARAGAGSMRFTMKRPVMIPALRSHPRPERRSLPPKSAQASSPIRSVRTQAPNMIQDLRGTHWVLEVFGRRILQAGKNLASSCRLRRLKLLPGPVARSSS